jgi:hypothetical protein
MNILAMIQQKKGFSTWGKCQTMVAQNPWDAVSSAGI